MNFKRITLSMKRKKKDHINTIYLTKPNNIQDEIKYTDFYI